MNNNHPILQQLKPHYFWDVDFSKLDVNTNKRLIIKRVITLGSIDEIGLIVNHYGKPAFISEIKKIALDPKTLNFVSRVFDIPKNEFECYTMKPLTPLHWNL